MTPTSSKKEEYRRETDWDWLTEVLSRYDITEKVSLRRNAHDFTSLEARLYREIQNRYRQRKKPNYIVTATRSHTSKQYEDSLRIHGDQVETMKRMGYGLMLDGFTFYKFGYELEPYDFEQNFQMHQAYEIHDFVKSELTQALKELKEEAVTPPGYVEVKVVRIEAIDNKIKELEG